MTEPLISLFASAIRPNFWWRFYYSLAGNHIPFEVCFVGPNPPIHPFPDNFRFEKSNCKPSQCYDAAFRMCRGELVCYTADDADYNEPRMECPNVLDVVWDRYEKSIKAHNDKKTILAMRPFEDNADMWNRHRFFHNDENAPRMAPLGAINREFVNSLGGYGDRNFICGQSENDLVMRALEAGGRVEVVLEAKMYLHHKDSHGGDKYIFRHGYNSDREYLERCWVKEGYGTYEEKRPYTLSPTRLLPFEGFSADNLLTENQGPAGRWNNTEAVV